MKGAPWHCGFEMRMTGGYQCGGDSEWAGFRCTNPDCGHQQTEWGHVEHNDKGEPIRFVPKGKRILTVVMHKPFPTSSQEVLCRGISQDEIVFTNLLYLNENIAVQSIGKHYSARGFRCVFNLPQKGKA